MRFGRVLAALVGLHLILLIAVLHQGLGHLLDVEEDFVAFVATEILAGHRLPLTSYVYTDYEAGTLYVGLLATPVFWALGPTVLALKSVSIGIALLTLALVGVVGRRFVGDRAALLAVALLACGPPAWIFRALQTFGDTSEAIPLALAQWGVFLAWQAREDPGRRWLVGQAALAGLATSFSLATAPFQLALLLAGWSTTARVRPDRVAALVVGFALGFAVPLLNWAAYGIPFYNVRGKGIATAGTGPLAWLGSLLALFRPVGAPGFFLLDHPSELLPGLRYLPAVWNALILGPVFALVWIRRTDMLALLRSWLPGAAPLSALAPVDLLLLLHGGFLAAYLVTSYQSGYLLLLIAPSGALLAAHAVLGDDGARARWAAAWAGALLVVALAPLAALWMPPPATTQLGTPAGTDAHWRGGVRMRHLPPVQPGVDLRRLAASLSGPDVEPRELFGVGMLLPLTPTGPPAFGPLAAALTPDRREQLARGFGYGMAWNGSDRHEQAIDALRALAPSLRAPSLRGFGRCLGERFHRVGAEELRARLFSRLEGPDREACLEGFGYGYGWRMWNCAQYFGQEMLPLGADAYPAVMRGLLRRLETLPRRPDVAGLVPELMDLLPPHLRDLEGE